MKAHLVLFTGLQFPNPPCNYCSAVSVDPNIYKPGGFDTSSSSLWEQCAMWLQKRNMNSSTSLLNKQNADACGELNICISLQALSETWKCSTLCFYSIRQFDKTWLSKVLLKEVTSKEWCPLLGWKTRCAACTLHVGGGSITGLTECVTFCLCGNSFIG